MIRSHKVFLCKYLDKSRRHHSAISRLAPIKLKLLTKRVGRERESASVRALGRWRCRMGAGAFLKVVAKNFDVLAGPIITLVYPLYASIKAIETKSPDDDQQWLTYWVLYSFITLFELTFAIIIEWLPIWSYAKLIFMCWLVLPYFNGAAYVYQQFVRPLLVNHQTVNIWNVPTKKNIFSKPDDVLTAAEKYIKENGTEAFEKLINKSEGSSKCRGSRRTILEEVQAEKDHKSWSDDFPIYDEDYRY